MSNENSINTDTRICPCCGEEIKAIAKKCRFCGEWLNEQAKTVQCPYCAEDISSNDTKCPHCGENLQNIKSSNKFEQLDVNESWKKRFAIVEKQVVDGKWWKMNPEFRKLPLKKRGEIGKGLVLDDFLSWISPFLFGILYYLIKGMWLKAIVYFAITLLIEFVIVSLVQFSIPEYRLSALYGMLYGCFAPYDYYRYKVLGKQW